MPGYDLKGSRQFLRTNLEKRVLGHAGTSQVQVGRRLRAPRKRAPDASNVGDAARTEIARAHRAN